MVPPLRRRDLAPKIESSADLRQRALGTPRQSGLTPPGWRVTPLHRAFSFLGRGGAARRTGLVHPVRRAPLQHSPPRARGMGWRTPGGRASFLCHRTSFPNPRRHPARPAYEDHLQTLGRFLVGALHPDLALLTPEPLSDSPLTPSACASRFNEETSMKKE